MNNQSTRKGTSWGTVVLGTWALGIICLTVRAAIIAVDQARIIPSADEADAVVPRPAFLSSPDMIIDCIGEEGLCIG